MIDWSNFNSCLVIEVTRREGIFTCSGVAINRKTILTAAHCLEGEILDIRVSQESAYQEKGNFFEADSYELHPDYNRHKSNYRNDIAKIVLKTELPADTNFLPIMKSTKNLTGKLLRLGYGARNFQNLRTLVAPQLRSHRSLEHVLELDDVYSFSGDSGGPVFLQNQGQMYLVALHSTLSFGPEGKHSFNPMLINHRDWIESSINAIRLGEELQRAV